ncbi:aminoglycoside phosphotransferase family protein [Streptomyces sp. MK5]|uniref:aminoglycoside phosphotransferase family protein n=1 Tax=Streptomyces sp. MK5 TaxID=3064253 RepID=UPI0027411E86|nr:aminoglycoside phosphotransferase family protein [Streptomyces sp. MK5]
MRAHTPRPGERALDALFVRRLIADRFPRWAGLPLTAVASAGTSNVMYRLGEDMVVRLPRTAGAAGDVAKEHTWLPRLAPLLPVAVPEPLGRGAPAEGWPWPWSVYRWLDGENPAVGTIGDSDRLAEDLAGFVVALHSVDPAGGPASYRCEPLAARDAETRKAIAELRGAVDAPAATALWEEALRAPAPAGPPVWIHADLQPGNVLVAGGRLGAVIDFGCLGLGDPAVDLIAAWYVLRAGAREVFRAALGTDETTWTRGRGWALSIALIELLHYRDRNPYMATVARHVLHELLHAHAVGPNRPSPTG